MEAATTPDQDTPTEEATLAALVVLLLADLPTAELIPQVQAVLEPLGISPNAAEEATRLIYPHVEVPEPDPVKVATAKTLATRPVRQAAYLRNAAERIARGSIRIEGDKRESAGEKERRYLQQHLDAERAREAAATKADRAAAIHGPVLGWRTQRDAKVTPDCRRLDGTNFNVAAPPEGLYPGMRHGATCRCFAGAPWPRPRLVSLTETRSSVFDLSELDVATRDQVNRALERCTFDFERLRSGLRGDGHEAIQVRSKPLPRSVEAEADSDVPAVFLAEWLRGEQLQLAFIAEGAHMVDFFFFADSDRDAIHRIYHGGRKPDHGWFAGSYWHQVGEAFMVAFVRAYSDLEYDDEGFTHRTTDEIAAKVKAVIETSKGRDGGHGPRDVHRHRRTA